MIGHSPSRQGGGGYLLWTGKKASGHLGRPPHQREMAEAPANGRLQTYYQFPETRTSSWKKFEVYKKAQHNIAVLLP